MDALARDIPEEVLHLRTKLDDIVDDDHAMLRDMRIHPREVFQSLPLHRIDEDEVKAHGRIERVEVADHLLLHDRAHLREPHVLDMSVRLVDHAHVAVNRRDVSVILLCGGGEPERGVAIGSAELEDSTRAGREDHIREELTIRSGDIRDTAFFIGRGEDADILDEIRVHTTF